MFNIDEKYYKNINLVNNIETFITSTVDKTELKDKYNESKLTQNLNIQNSQLTEIKDDYSNPFGNLYGFYEKTNINDISNDIEKNKLLVNSQNLVLELEQDLGEYIKRVCYFKLAHEVDVNSVLASSTSSNSIYELRTNIYKNYESIINIYNDLYGEKPTYFITFMTYITYITDKCILSRDYTNYPSLKTECSNIPYDDYLEGEWDNVLQRIGIDSNGSSKSDNVNLYRNPDITKDYSSYIEKDYNKHFTNVLSNMTTRIYEVSKKLNGLYSFQDKINISGANFVQYIDLFLKEIPEYNEGAYKYQTFENGRNIRQISEIPSFPVNPNQMSILSGIYYWCWCYYIYSIKSTLCNELYQMNMFLDNNKGTITNYSPSQLTEWYKNAYSNLEKINNKFYNNKYIKQTNKYQKVDIDNELRFKNILESAGYPSDYKNLCYYFSTKNSEGSYYVSCSKESNDRYYQLYQYSNDNTINNTLDQYYNNRYMYLLSKFDYNSCKFFKDKYCTSSEMTQILSSLSSQEIDIRDTIQNELIKGVKNENKTISKHHNIETFIGNIQEGMTNQYQIIGNVKFNDNVNNIIKNQEFNIDGSLTTLKQYTEDKLNESTCAPENTPYFSASYKCGNVPNENLINKKTVSDYILFDCSNPENNDSDVFGCSEIILELLNSGIVIIYRKDLNKESTAEGSFKNPLWLWDPKIEKDVFNLINKSSYLSESNKTTLLGGESLENGEYIVSPDGSFKLMNKDGTLKLYYTVSSCLKNDKDQMFGFINHPTDSNIKTIGLHNLEGTNIKHLGKSGYIDINGNLQYYDNPKNEYSNKYINVGNYVTSHTSNLKEKPSHDNMILNKNNKSIIYSAGSSQDCIEKCNLYDDCGGFVYKDGQCRLKNKNIFPVGLRKADPDNTSELHIRMKGFNHVNNTCPTFSKEAINLENKKVDEYIESGAFIDKERNNLDDTCNVPVALSKYLTEYNKIKNELMNSISELSNEIENLTDEEVKSLTNYNINVDSLQKNIHEYDRLYKLTDENITKLNSVSITLEESKSFMDLENIKFLSYVGITIILLMITIRMINK